MNRVLIGIGLFILLLWSGLCPAAEPAPETPREQSAAAAYEYRDPLLRDTPRGALQGFMQYAREGDYQTAAEYLDLRFLPAGMTVEQGPLYARQLLAIIERNLWLNPQELDDTPEGKSDDKLPAYREGFARLEAEKKAYQLLLQRVPSSEYGSLWKVSNATVAKLPKLYQALGYGPVVEWFIEHIPEGRLFTLNLWEWAMMLAYLALAFLFVVPVTWLLQWPLSRSSHPLKAELGAFIRGPLRFFAAVALDRAMLANSTLSAAMQEIVNTGFFFILATVWLIWALVGLAQSSLRERWIAKGNKQAASLLRPLGNFLRVALLSLATLLWLEHLGFNAGTILAGMGIGGLAIALASKQSIENLIGTITLYSAAPIKVGNIGNFGGVRGTVEEIGLRCTRIRTLDRSVIHMPNAKLAEMEIENISEREKIRFKTEIRLDYSTDAKQLQAIINDIKALLKQHEKVDESPMRVTFKGFGNAGLELNVLAYVGTTSLPVYQEVAEELQLGIMAIVAEHGSKMVPVWPVSA
ncbi:mechanosensitive ion channel family protein [Shewanella algae]|uniref:mechanosensitive ion channel family protein n=1 Tax=Shewanella algae TaxID=38313 RepID=UPI0031F4C5EB